MILIEKIEGHCGGITTLLSNSSRQIISYHTNGELRIYNYTESIDNDDEDEIELNSHKKRKIVYIINFHINRKHGKMKKHLIVMFLYLISYINIII